MKFRKVRALRGPNIWANFPVLEAWLELGAFKDSPSDQISGFNERFMAWLPTIIHHRCSLGVHGGFFERLRRGTYPAHIVEHTTLELQTLAGTEVGYGRARETSEEGVDRVVVEYLEEDVGRMALNIALEIFLAAAHGHPYDVDGQLARLTHLAQNIRLGPSTGAIVRAAHARAIPSLRLSPDSLVQLGYGAKQRRILSAATSSTSTIAEEIAQDKQLTRDLLARMGVPVPAGQVVSNAEDAWQAAGEIGLPVVVKPRYGNHGRHVAIGLNHRDEVLAAYAAASQEEPDVIVERCVTGADWRILVVGGKLVAAARREPAHVVGDGLRTVHELVARVNADPRRGEGHNNILSLIRVDDEARDTLERQGYREDSVPPAGVKVYIHRTANLSTGGTAVDVTDSVHPSVAAHMVMAAQVVGLDIAGMDIVADDIARPLEEQGGALIEVNARPGLRMHLSPSEGKGRPVGEEIIATLFPPGENGRIPIISITGVNGKTTTTRLIAHILEGTGKRVGMSCTEGIFANGRTLDQGDCSGPKSARTLLHHPGVDAVVLETARGGILREGLGFDLCQVGVVTNISEGDHLGHDEIVTVEDLVKVKRCVVEAVAPNGWAVLNANDPLVAGMAEKCPGQVIFFALDERHPVIVEHRSDGGRAAFLRGDAIILAESAGEHTLTTVWHVPLTRQGRIPFQTENVLAAAAACWALDIPLEQIRHHLASFSSGMNGTPARFNILPIQGGTVIVDYGHNPSALAAVLGAMEHYSSFYRTAVYSAPGDRRDQDIIRQGELLGDAFDRVILYEDHYTRGRAEGETIALFRQGLAKGKRVKEIKELYGALAAAKLALEQMQPGELLLLQADVVDETVVFLHTFLREHGMTEMGEDQPSP